jgi:tetratricopeptide (TPR) repeat protein
MKTDLTLSAATFKSLSIMTIAEYHQHHSLQDEEDLFHSSLSDEFDDNYTSRVGSGSRPWRNRTQRKRDPYELLDDVPPAQDLMYSRAVTAAAVEIRKPAIVSQQPLKKDAQLFPDLLEESPPANMSRAATDRVDNRTEIRRFESEVNMFPEGLLEDGMESVRASDAVENQREDNEKKQPNHLVQRDRYPVEELYPTDNADVMMTDGNEMNNEVEYELTNDDDYYSHMQYSEPVANGPSRYPIDDGYCSEEEKSTRGRKKVVWYDEQSNDQPMVISPAGSDGEIDSYQPMHIYNSSNKGKLYDEHDENASSHCSDDNKSTGTFDRLYDEEYSGIYSTPIDKSENRDVKKSQPSIELSSKEDSSLLLRMSPKHSPDSVMDTPSSTGSFLGDLEFGVKLEDNVVKEQIDNKQSPAADCKLDLMPTPLRCNKNEMKANAIIQANEMPEVPFGAESSTPNTEADMQVDETLKSSKSDTPQSNTTTSSSPGFESDEDSAIQDLARIMQEQQRQHREKQRVTRKQDEREVRRENQPDPDSRGGGRMSRLEQWQQKQKLRQQQRKQQTTGGYLPSKYQQDQNTAPSQKKQTKRSKLEPEDVDAQEPGGLRYYGDQREANLFPDMEWDEHGRVIKKSSQNQSNQVHAAPGHDPPGWNPNQKDYANLSVVSSATERIRHPASPPGVARSMASSRGGSYRRQIYHSGPNHHVPDELSLFESYDESSDDNRLVNNSHLVNDDVSVISVDTELRRLAEHVPMRNKLQNQRLHPYSIKPKDSMESDMRLDVDYEYREQPHDRSYNVVKRNDSMEDDMMVVDFDEGAEPVKHKFSEYSISDGGVSIVDYYEDRSHENNSVVSPPEMKRKLFAFADQIEEEEEEDVFEEMKSYSDDSEATNDPAIFPTRAVYQMNLGQHSIKKVDCESSDLIERACAFLARGMNDAALTTLNEALNNAEASMDKVKELMDEYYYKKERRLKPPTSEELLHQEQYEEKLDSDFKEVAGEMADVINNIGVVQELNGEYHLAMNSFRDALDIYRRMCHRHENSGDADVDRAVSNIMHMGIAMRSREKREELHLEAEDLDEMIKAADEADERMELRIERLNVLMAVLEVENENLGQSK